MKYAKFVPFHAGAPSQRAVFLFVNFFLIITAYYHLKPASRSLFIEYLGADRLPYVWIGTALILLLAMPVYQRLVAHRPRETVVIGTCLGFTGLLGLFWILLLRPGAAVAASFYIFVDILSVVMVEQFWSLANSLYTTADGRRWYGVIGTGGLVGGVTGGAMAAGLIRLTPLDTTDLLLVAATIVVAISLLTVWMGRLGLYRSGAKNPSPHDPAGGWRVLVGSRYLLLIAALLLLAQMAQPVVEFQFLKAVEAVYTEREARTVWLSGFFSILGLVSIAVNLGLTPLIHRLRGAIAGLLVQPLALGLTAGVFLAHPTLMVAAVMKISDRGLSYSINRASKELLYIPIDPVLIYQAKAWIDMFGYRLFKVVGSLAILLLTQWLPWRLAAPDLSWLTLSICGAWIAIIVAVLRHDYRRIAERLYQGYQVLRSPKIINDA